MIMVSIIVIILSIFVAMLNKFIKFVLPLFLTLNLYGADFYWVGGSGNWSDFSNHWSTASNGTAFHSNAPTLADDVYFDSNSASGFSDTIFIDVNAVCNNFELDGFNKLKQLANFTVFGKFDLIQGDFIGNGFNLNINQFYSDYNFFRTFDISNSTLNLTGSDTVWIVEPTSFSFIQSGGVINLVFTGSDLVTFSSGGPLIEYETLNCAVDELQFIENSTFTNLTLTPGLHLYLPALTVNGLPLTLKGTTINSLGNCMSPIIIEGVPLNSASTQASLDMNTGTLNADYTWFENLNGTNGTYVAVNSIDLGGNTGIGITEDPSTATVSWINGTGNWSDPSHWSTGCVPGPNNSVLFNAASFTAPNQMVNVDVNAFCDNMTWTGVDNPILIGTTNDIFIRGDLELDPNMTTTFSESFNFRSITAVPKTIESNGVVLNGKFVFNSVLGSHDFLDDFMSSNSIEIILGTVSSIGRNMTLAGVLSGETLNRNFDITNSLYTLTGIDSTWVMNPTNLTLTTAGSEIIINHSQTDISIVKGGGQVYNIFRFSNIQSSLYDNNTFSILEISPNSSISLESGMTQTMDSLVANGSCTEMITIESTDNFGAAAEINKTGFDTLVVSSVNLMNVTSVATAPKYNLGENSTVSYTTTGWDTTDIGQGTEFYWVNGSGEWKDISHWESPLGSPALCLPTIRDTVYFNAASFLLNNDSVLVNSDAYFSHMDWAGSEIWNPRLHLVKNLYCRNNILLNSSMAVVNSNVNAQIKFIPENNNCLFTSFETPIAANICLSGLVLADTLLLDGDLKIDSLNSLFIAGGTFDSNSDSIVAGSFKSLGTIPNLVLLNDSEIELNHELDFTSLTTLICGTSHIYFNSLFDQGVFRGASHVYNDVSMESVSIDNDVILTGDNGFNDLTFIKGLTIKLGDGETQSVNGNFMAIGNCLDSIIVMAESDGVIAMIDLAVVGNAECVSSKDIAITTSSLNALFSSDISNNTGLWNFDATPHSIAGFTTTYQQCLNDVTTFTNTSNSYTGGLTNLTFDWDFGDGNSSTLSAPTLTYGSAEKFYVSLTTTYSNFCTNTYSDSVNINNPVGQLTSSDVDTTICATESVILSGLSLPQADTFDFIIDGVSDQNGTAQTYTLTDLNDGEVVTLEVTLNGCTTTSTDALTFVVNPLPNVLLTATNNVICDGDDVTFSATGADVYKFYIDGLAQTAFTTTDTYSSSSLVDGQVISVLGRDTVTTCEKSGNVAITMTVNPNPIPLMANSDTDNVICDGDPVIMTGSVATEFEFFINGNSIQGPSTTATLTSSTLDSGDELTMIGYDLGCGTLSADSYTFIVNPIPNVSLVNSTGTTICENDNVEFTASGATAYEFFIGTTPVQGPSGLPSYSSSNLLDGASIYVVGSANNCFSNSSVQTFTVNPLPVPVFSNTDADTTICQNEMVTFNTSGASTYQFLLDGFPISTYSATTTYVTDSLNNGQVVTVMGEQLGCYALSTNVFDFTVKPSFNVNLFSSDIDLTICEGELIDFTGVAGSGVTSYDLYVNGALENSAATNSFNLTNLNEGTQLVSLSATKNGCTYFAEDTLAILVKPIPTVTLTSSDPDNIICSGDSVLFVAAGAFEYSFLLDGLSQGMVTEDSLYLSNLSDGQVVSVSGTLNGCSAISGTYTFTVNDVPNVVLFSDDVNNILCEGDNITFTGSGATNYEFYLNGVSQGVSSITSVLATSTLISNTIVELEGESNGCSAVAASINVTVNSLPDISTIISDADTTVCEGDLVTISANGASTYQMLINNVATSSYNIQNVFTTNSLVDGDVISMQGGSASGCFSESPDVFTFSVNPNPIVVLSSSDADSVICISDAVTFNVTGADTYSYYVDDVLATLGTTYLTDSIQNGQIISVEGELSGCVSVSNLIPYTVYLYPITFMVTADVDSTICVGDSIIFQGQGAFDYEFFVNGNSVQAASVEDSLYITSLVDGDVVTVSGMNNGCQTISNPIPVSVITYPVTNLLSSDPNNEICYGEIVTFTSSGATNYEFFVNDISQGVPSPITSFSTTTLNHSDSVWVVGSNGECVLNAPESYELIVNTLPLTLTSAGNNLICSGENVSYSSSGADLYEFFVDGVSIQAQSPNSTFNSSSLQDGQVVTVYGFSTATGCNQLAQTSHLLTVMNNPIITALNATTICEGDSTVLESSSATWNQWFDDPDLIIGANEESYKVYETGDYYTEITFGGDGDVLAIGNNAFGQFGDGTVVSSFDKVNTNNLENITEVKAGKHHNLALDGNGVVYAWGENTYGQIGTGNYTTQTSPYTTNITDAITVSAGHEFSLAVSTSGEVVSWGRNDDGQLGIGTTATTNFPVIIQGLTNVNTVSAGKNHSLALMNDGTVWAWGDNQFGQLGLASFTNQNTPQEVISLSGIETINCGANHSMAVDSLGNLYVWGHNSEGQLGLNDIQFSNVPVLLSLDNIQAVDGGFSHTLALTNDNRLYSWGNNNSGQLGTGDNTNAMAPVYITSLDAVKTIATNFNTNYIIKNDNSVWSWGENIGGQLGNGNNLDQNTPAHVPSLTGVTNIGVGESHGVFLAGFSNSCPSNIINVVVNPSPLVVLTMANGVLSVSPAGNAYQWYVDGILIPGATAVNYTPVTPGYYTCEVLFNGGCSSLSDEYPHKIVGLELSENLEFSVYPNPSHGQFIISGDFERIGALEILVYNTLGQVVDKVIVDEAKTTIEVDLNVESGLYIISIQSTERRLGNYRVIIE